MKFYLSIVCGLVFDFVGAQQAPAIAMERDDPDRRYGCGLGESCDGLDDAFLLERSRQLRIADRAASWWS